MKKTLKALVLALVIGLIVISLTGCGGNKLVATKTTEDEMMGNCKEEITVTFKNDKVETVKMVMEFDDEETAQGMYGLLSLGMSMSEDGELNGMEFEQDGKKITMTMTAEAYAASEEVSDEDMTKEAIKAALEEDGYEVK
ncbi:MAG: hypothetical protein IJE59_04155 [Clostridia bacterium]|nr:hypothetical protein [Clostridia bacterium]